eukprot:GILJ01022542.1.p1 GENE.GILJ01022542.1~~GILJ01022542.1.p1  ORF type:complete len:518 (+),score=104.84 GILJ01022542.1:127-1554(+)
MANSMRNTNNANSVRPQGNDPQSQSMRARMSISQKPSISSQLVRGSFRGNGSSSVPVVVSTTPSEAKTAGFTTEDRRAVSKLSSNVEEDEEDNGPLFMPGMKREQFIPVRVAREKIKEVLSEMAQMKHKHLAAIETMEKQHQYLKNQLETACAAYAKKLTNDYNTRVNALDAEYCRRLAKLSVETAAGEVEERLRTARENAAEMEEKTEERLAAKDRDVEAIRSQLTLQLDRERSNRDDLQNKLKVSEDRTRELEIQNAAMNKELDALRDGVELPQHNPADEERLRGLQAQNDQLEQQVAALQRHHDEETVKLEEEIANLENELNGLRNGGLIQGGGGPSEYGNEARAGSANEVGGTFGYGNRRPSSGTARGNALHSQPGEMGYQQEFETNNDHRDDQYYAAAPPPEEYYPSQQEQHQQQGEADTSDHNYYAPPAALDTPYPDGENGALGDAQHNNHGNNGEEGGAFSPQEGGAY